MTSGVPQPVPVAGPACCLAIGTSDSSGGAGVQGDIKAFAAIGCYAATVVVGVTAQNTRSVLARHDIPPKLIRQQLHAVLNDLPVCAVKVGMTWSRPAMAVVAETLRPLAVPVVVDPVMVTAAGAFLAGGRLKLAGAARELLLPLATVVTPNLREAVLLTGLPAEAGRAALSAALVAGGAGAAVITGDRGDGVQDWVFDGQRHTELAGAHYPTSADHGAGCAHSALLTGLLARGVPLVEAARTAGELAARGVRDGLVAIGGGRHPVDLLGLSTRTGRPPPT